MTSSMFEQAYEMNPEELGCQGVEELAPCAGSENREAPAYVMWKQRDGTMIRIKDMDDKHLFHTIKMLERNADGRLRAAKLAQHACDKDYRFEYAREQFLRPTYYKLTALAEARGTDFSVPGPPPSPVVSKTKTSRVKHKHRAT